MDDDDDGDVQREGVDGVGGGIRVAEGGNAVCMCPCMIVLCYLRVDP